MLGPPSPPQKKKHRREKKEAQAESKKKSNSGEGWGEGEGGETGPILRRQHIAQEGGLRWKGFGRMEVRKGKLERDKSNLVLSGLPSRGKLAVSEGRSAHTYTFGLSRPSRAGSGAVVEEEGRSGGRT